MGEIIWGRIGSVPAVPHKLQPVSLRDKTASATDPAQLGFIALDVEAVLPELVSGEGDQMKGLAMDGLIPVTVRAVQELARRIEASDATVVALC